MVIKVYFAGICGTQEVRKRQQRVLFTLGGMKLDHEPIDITEAGKEEEREFMREQCLKHNKNPLPPQIFNDDEYCGDYYDFELANDDDRLLPFLKLQAENGTKEIEEPPLTNGNAAELTNGLSHHQPEPDEESHTTKEEEETAMEEDKMETVEEEEETTKEEATTQEEQEDKQEEKVEEEEEEMEEIEEEIEVEEEVEEEVEVEEEEEEEEGEEN